MSQKKNPHAVALGRRGGKANKGIPKPKSAANLKFPPRKYPQCPRYKAHRFRQDRCPCGFVRAREDKSFSAKELEGAE